MKSPNEKSEFLSYLTTPKTDLQIVTDPFLESITNTLVLELIRVTQLVAVLRVVRDPDEPITTFEIEIRMPSRFELMDIQDSVTTYLEFILEDSAGLDLGILLFRFRLA